MIPHFERQEAFPYHDDNASETSAANEPTYDDADKSVSLKEKISKLSTRDLFIMRQAHEMNLKLGYREAKIDTDVIDEIKQHMEAAGINESEYDSFLNPKV
jgi:hypothetical protein